MCDGVEAVSSAWKPSPFSGPFSGPFSSPFRVLVTSVKYIDHEKTLFPSDRLEA